MSEKTGYKQAVLWEALEDDKVKCKLCRWGCVIADGRFGYCRVRKNIGGILYSLNYDKVCAANADPIEKKPLFHFQPGSRSFSIACVGCNFRCEFCQNWHISQADLKGNTVSGESLSAEQIVEAAIRKGCDSIAYTYTEPTVFMELCDECGRLAKAKGLKNVFVSNGYMSRETIDFCRDWLDGINIDLKSFNDDYYKRLCHAGLEGVTDTIKYIANETDIWMEVTTLIVPGENDSEPELNDLARFIATEAGIDVPWHISRFYPSYHMDSKDATSIKVLEQAERIGREAGLRYVYLGNVPGRGENTVCYHCGAVVIERYGYNTVIRYLDRGRCAKCGFAIAGVF